MEHEDFNKKVDRILSSVKDGRKRYNTSPIFNHVVNLVADGADVMQVILHLCSVMDDNLKSTDDMTTIPVSKVDIEKDHTCKCGSGEHNHHKDVGCKKCC